MGQLDISQFNPRPQLTVVPTQRRTIDQLKDEAEPHPQEISLTELEHAPNEPLQQGNQGNQGNQEVLDPNPKADLRVPGALRGIDLSKIQSRSEFIATLTNSIPNNEFNLPSFIYRPDCLDHNLLHQESEDKFEVLSDMLNAAVVQLQYHEGYPAMPSGKPFWDQFEFETVQDFALFQQYRDLPGARQLGLVVAADREHLQEIFHLYYWRLRCLAHDAFAIAHYQRLREQRILSTGNTHFLQAEALLQKLQNHFSQIDWKIVQDPSKYVEILEKIVKIQRLSLEQGTSKRGQEESTPQSLEIIMRKIAGAHQTTTVDEQARSSSDVSALLADPELASTAQELIIRMNK